MLCAGATLHPVSQAAAPLILAGSTATSAALTLPLLTSLPFGGGLKGANESVSVTAAVPTLRPNADRLQDFAWLACGDAQQARSLVEEALAEARARKLRGEERDAFTLRLLVAMLANVRERTLLGATRIARAKGASPQRQDVDDPKNQRTLDALDKLTAPVRIAFLLSSFWLMPSDGVAAILGWPLEQVASAVAEGSQAVGPTL
ncbi:MAG TPA: hypothetical protein VN892_01725 [Solirubrobacteraceae bacterium]|nr:hypothetical protein [Solirubrobacteraceae bacterium]